MGNPWDTIIDTIGDAKPDDLFYQVGVALSSWEYLEGAIASLFGAILGVGGFNTIVAERALGTVSNSKGRSVMLVEAINTAFTQKQSDASAVQLKVELLDFISKVKSFSSRRNEIAHGAVTEFGEGFSHKGYFLCPASYNIAKYKTLNYLDPTYRFNAATVLHFGQEFGKLHQRGVQLGHRTYPLFAP